MYPYIRDMTVLFVLFVGSWEIKVCGTLIHLGYHCHIYSVNTNPIYYDNAEKVHIFENKRIELRILFTMPYNFGVLAFFTCGM